ncbi:MAG: hypothetical protein K6U04_08760 [Armatimonadetes bacterium]|nr:hypothetical protein [Armatimonadota bacterium]
MNIGANSFRMVLPARLQQLQRKERHKAAQDAADESGKHEYMPPFLKNF